MTPIVFRHIALHRYSSLTPRIYYLYFTEKSRSMLINQSIKSLNKTADFDLKIQTFREKLLNIQADVESLIFGIFFIAIAL